MYDLKDEQIKLIYSKIKQCQSELDDTDTSFHEEVALLMSFINRFLNLDTDELSRIDIERMRLIMQMIDMKAKIINNQRQHLERKAKIDAQRMKLESIPLQTFKDAVSKISYIMVDFLPASDLSKLMVKLDEVIAEVSGFAGKS